jgi:hypothetical protein
MGMFYLKNPAMMKGFVFPKELAVTLCVDFACKGRDCNAENCAYAHPRRSKDIDKLDVDKIACFFKQNKHGYLSEYHFRKIVLSETAKSMMGGADGITSSKTD